MNLNKLREKFKEKASLLMQNDIDIVKYFENLGCEIMVSDIPFLGNKDFVPVQFTINMTGWTIIGKDGNIIVNGKRVPRHKAFKLSVPVNLVEKVLVLGDLP